MQFKSLSYGMDRMIENVRTDRCLPDVYKSELLQCIYRHYSFTPGMETCVSLDFWVVDR